MVTSSLKAGDCSMWRTIQAVVIAALLATGASAKADESSHAANVFASVASDLSMHCGVKHDSRSIICIVNASDRETEQLAGSMVMIARSEDLPLRDWVLVVVNLNDYVVSRNF